MLPFLHVCQVDQEYRLCPADPVGVNIVVDCCQRQPLSIIVTYSCVEQTSIKPFILLPMLELSVLSSIFGTASLSVSVVGSNCCRP